MFFFFFKQKTAYEMRISDWSSDVCSSDLTAYTGSDTNNAEATCNGLDGAQTSASGLPPCASTTMLSKMKNPNPAMMPVTVAISGATTTALASLDNTVSRSDTGNDFQNSTLRSLRSSNRLPRQ